MLTTAQDTIESFTQNTTWGDPSFQMFAADAGQTIQSLGTGSSEGISPQERRSGSA